VGVRSHPARTRTRLVVCRKMSEPAPTSLHHSVPMAVLVSVLPVPCEPRVFLRTNGCNHADSALGPEAIRLFSLARCKARPSAFQLGR
jgi:hypothetical protein